LIRSLLFYCIFFTTLIFASILIILASLFFSVTTAQKIGSFWILNILKVLKYLCGIAWEVEGLTNLPNKPFVMLANHQGPWESLFLQTLVIPTSSIIKKEILYIPFFGWAIAMLHPISINRKEKYTSLKRIMHIGGQRIRAGYTVLLFPEGTRRDHERGIGKFGNSGGMLAVNENVSVIPICHNSGVYWKNRSLRKQPGKISVVVGAPITGSDPKEITNQAHAWIKKTYERIG